MASTLYTELAYKDVTEKVQAVRFHVMSPDEIKRMSVVHTTSDTFLGNEPIPNGLFDPRMGVIEPNKVCVTCGLKQAFCNGHFGHIELARPMYYVQFFDMVKKIMRCVCFRCSKILLAEEDVAQLRTKKYSRQKRFDTVYKMCSKSKSVCHFCGCVQPSKISRDTSGKNMLAISMDWKTAKSAALAGSSSAALVGSSADASKYSSASGSGSQQNADGDEATRLVLYAEDSMRILSRISDEDCETMGLSPKYCRPEWMICTILSVPPPCVRPSVRSETGQRSEDDLTHKLCEIIKYNTSLQQKINKGVATKETIDIASQMLQYQVATLVDSNIPGMNPATQRTGRLLKTLTARLKGKDGRIRGNLMGKRVDFSARSVITPDPNISIDELGVPIKIAMNMTFPEIVNSFNIERIRKYVLNGPDVFPGARFVKQGNRTLWLKKIDRNSISLRPGDVVQRHLMDGDVVLFNRQPSLHRMSMMGHRVRVMKFNTFRLNPLVCACYNADFDGDEMNMHVPQSITSKCELEMIAAVPYQIMSPRNCQPIVGVVQDITLGLYRLTKSGVTIDPEDFMKLVSTNTRFLGEIPDLYDEKKNLRKAFTGRELLSSIIPPSVNVRTGNSSIGDPKTDKENFVIIENGNLVQGIVDKNIYQKATKGLVHAIYNDIDQDEARHFLDNTQRLICNWLMMSGFSVGMSDLVLDEETKGNLKTIINESKANVYKMLKDVHTGKFVNTSIYANNDFFEAQVNMILNDARNKTGDLARSKINDNENRLVNMIKSGSKGSPVNMAQILACVGQQNVDNKRIAYGFDHRTLPHFCKYDDGPDARGFVENSFISGLTPQEFFFHAMGGREGLIDTAVKSVTGDTPIVIIENGVSKYVAIGDWIDEHLSRNKDKVKYYPEDRNLELLDFEHQVHIPTTDEDGHVTWGQMTAVTRHDPGDVLYEIKTHGGREVIVTASKSLLIWREDEKKFREMLTGDVKVGDCVPVTANLCEPPVIVDHVDMTQYFPKEEYVHGTEFNKAKKMIEEVLQGRKRVPAGWWQKHNGKSFTVPYDRIQTFMRAISGRSNMENIKDGCVYPYHAKRDQALIPARFELNKENGTFIGLFLADGCVDERSGKVCITKHDEDVRKFAVEWMDKFKINNVTKTEQKERGISITVEGNSVLLARFLDRFVGHGARNKFVPDVAFTAPEEFILGLLNGYFSGDGCVSRGSLMGYSVSKRMIEGIAMLCSRLGSFGKILKTQQKSNNVGTQDIAPMYTLSYRACFALNLAHKLDLLVKYKDEALKQLSNTSEYRSFKCRNHVVLDTIKEIIPVDVSRYAKMYDVTVPSTLNFGLANGLQVQDTSETGYLQRKLVKAMEDCKVACDFTVRNANGYIIQFLYGEDGIDPTRLESQQVFTVDMPYIQLLNDFLITRNDDFEVFLSPAVIDEMKAKPDEWEPEFKKHFEQIVSDREYIITEVFKGRYDNSVMAPVSFQRLLVNAEMKQRQFGEAIGLLSDLSPIYVLKTINNLCDELYVSSTSPGNMLFCALLRSYMSPKRIALKYHLTKVVFDDVVSEVRRKYFQSITSPGEMVGVVAAQSIGEPTTQMTLNSVEWDTDMLFDVDGSFIRCPIGKFIDDYMLLVSPTEVEHHPNDTKLVKVVKHEVKVLSCNEAGKVTWERVEALTCHPPINEDGTRTLVRVRTESGREVTATKAKSFLRRENNKIVQVNGSEIKVGDYLPVSKVFPVKSDNIIEGIQLPNGKTIKLTKDFGSLCGEYLMNEKQDNIIFNGEDITQFVQGSFGHGSKMLPGWVLQAPDKFIDAILHHFTDLRKSTHIHLFTGIQQLFLRRGGVKTMFEDGWFMVNNQMDTYVPDIQLGTYFSGGYRREELPLIRLRVTSDKDKEVLDAIMQDDIMYDRVSSVEEVVSKHKYVYDLTVENTRNFNAFNGLALADTFHAAGISSASKAVQGVPRIKEILSVTKNIKAPCNTIYLKPHYRTQLQKVNMIAQRIQTTMFRDVVKTSEIYFDPSDLETGIDADKEFLATYREFQGINDMTPSPESPWVLRFEMDRDAMFTEGVSMLDLYVILKEFYGNQVSSWFSDDNSFNLVFRVRLSSLGASPDINDHLTELKALEKSIMNNVSIKGIKNIQRTSIVRKDINEYDEDNMEFMKTYEYVIETSGVNMREIMCIPEVDYTRVNSNHIYEIYEVLGIEAARQALLNEMVNVIKQASSYVNYRHFSLLVDIMTNRGYLLSIDRHGINRTDIGPLAKCSFEETMDMVIKAAVFSEVDKVKGVSANIMFGQIPDAGTGDTAVLIDHQLLSEKCPEVTVYEMLDEIDEVFLDFAFVAPGADPSVTQRVKCPDDFVKSACGLQEEEPEVASSSKKKTTGKKKPEEETVATASVKKPRAKKQK